MWSKLGQSMVQGRPKRVYLELTVNVMAATKQPVATAQLKVKAVTWGLVWGLPHPGSRTKTCTSFLTRQSQSPSWAPNEILSYFSSPELAFAATKSNSRHPQAVEQGLHCFFTQCVAIRTVPLRFRSKLHWLISTSWAGLRQKICFLFYQWGTWGPKRQSDLPRITKLF